jgi:hypothetical protein
MDLFAVVDQVIKLLRSRGRVSYRALRVQFHLDDEALEALKAELIEVHQMAVDQAGTMLVWTEDRGTLPEPLPRVVEAQQSPNNELSRVRLKPNAGSSRWCFVTWWTPLRRRHTCSSTPSSRRPRINPC